MIDYKLNVKTGLAALEDDSFESRQVFYRSFDSLAKKKSLESALDMVELLEAFAKKAQWPDLDPLEVWMARNESNKGSSILPRVVGYVKIASALLKMASVMGKPDELGKADSAIPLFEQALARCVASRWERARRLGFDGGWVAEVEACKKSPHWLSGHLAVLAERFQIGADADSAKSAPRSKSASI